MALWTRRAVVGREADYSSLESDGGMYHVMSNASSAEATK